MNGDKFLKWMITILLPLSIAFSSYILIRMDNLSEAKVSLSEYRQDQGELCTRLRDIESKIDRVWDYLRNDKKGTK